MSEQRFTDDFAPRNISTPLTYSARAAGPTRSAPLRTQAGQVVGRVWTDDNMAAGWLPANDGDPGPIALASRYAFGALAACYRAGVPASEVLDPARWAPLYVLGDPAADSGS